MGDGITDQRFLIEKCERPNDSGTGSGIGKTAALSESGSAQVGDSVSVASESREVRTSPKLVCSNSKPASPSDVWRFAKEETENCKL